jgi:beta-lactamase regulating signal transducer with metallopeptidase domain
MVPLDVDTSGLLSFGLEVILKGSVILAAAGLATSLLKKAPAAVRHTIWVAAIAGVAVLPAVIGYAPRVDVAVLPGEPGSTVIAPAPLVELDPSHVVSSDLSARSLPEVQVRSETWVSSDGAVPPVVSVASGSGSTFDWPLIVFAIWMTGIVILCLRYLIGWISLARIKKRAEPVADVVLRLAAIRIARSMGLNRRVRLVWGASKDMPMTWGWIRPTILIPDDAREWEMDKIQVVLTHELAHVKRHDCLVQVLVFIVSALYWFNPLVWIAAAQSRREREMACDDYVIRHGTEGETYADHLLAIARGMSTTSRRTAPSIAMARPSELEGRLMSILKSDQHRGATTPATGIVTMSLLAVFAFPLGALRPVPVQNSLQVVEPTLEWAEEEPAEESHVTASVLLETDKYIAQVNELVEEATRTLESIERLQPAVSSWQADFDGQAGEGFGPIILQEVISDPESLTEAQVKRLEAFGIDIEYIEDMASVGLNQLTIEELVSLAYAKVDRDLVLAFQRAGYRDLGPSQLIQLGFAGVDGDFVYSMASAGFRSLDASELVRLSHAGVNPEFVLEIRKSGLRDLTSSDLIQLKHAGIDGGFVKRVSRIGGISTEVDDLVRLKYLGLRGDPAARSAKDVRTDD